MQRACPRHKPVNLIGAFNISADNCYAIDGQTIPIMHMQIYATKQPPIYLIVQFKIYVRKIIIMLRRVCV